MNGIDPVWTQVEQFRSEYVTGDLAWLPVDVFIVAELNLRLDIIPFDGLFAKYQHDAMLDPFTGIYVDAEANQSLLHKRGPISKQKRFRFTFAHELGHFAMHQAIAADKKFADFVEFFQWMHDESPDRYRTEQEANEFAGRLLVPRDRLETDFAQLTAGVASMGPGWQANQEFRRGFADRLSDKYCVNAQVIEIRLDRESIWPAQ
jgi:hypothetical protein